MGARGVTTRPPRDENGMLGLRPRVRLAPQAMLPVTARGCKGGSGVPDCGRPGSSTQYQPPLQYVGTPQGGRSRPRWVQELSVKHP